MKNLKSRIKCFLFLFILNISVYLELLPNQIHSITTCLNNLSWCSSKSQHYWNKCQRLTTNRQNSSGRCIETLRTYSPPLQVLLTVHLVTVSRRSLIVGLYLVDLSCWRLCFTQDVSPEMKASAAELLTANRRNKLGLVCWLFCFHWGGNDGDLFLFEWRTGSSVSVIISIITSVNMHLPPLFLSDWSHTLWMLPPVCFLSSAVELRCHQVAAGSLAEGWAGPTGTVVKFLYFLLENVVMG